MSKPDIYRQHDTAFANVSAFVIVKDGERVATLAFKYPRDGAGRLYAYLHWIGSPMVRGYAGGYGYDKRSAAVYDAARRIDPAYFSPDDYGNTWETERAECEAFRAALVDARDGTSWENVLRDAGYTVWAAV